MSYPQYSLFMSCKKYHNSASLTGMSVVIYTTSYGLLCFCQNGGLFWFADVVLFKLSAKVRFVQS